MSGETIKALFWKQPYASMMLHGKTETRRWATHYRGLVLICTSQKPYTGGNVFEISGCDQATRIIQALREDCTLKLNGYAIAVGNLVDCRPMEQKDESDCYARYAPGLWCHVYEDVRKIRVPFKIKGRQGFMAMPDGLLDRIELI